MITNQQRAILELFLEADYVTAKSISEKLSISERSVRNRIKEINEECKSEQIAIHSRARYGFFVEKSVREKLYYLLDRNKQASDVPVSSEERFQFLSVYLLNLRDYIKIDDLCDLIYVSRGTLSLTLKKVEQLYADFDIRIVRRPNYGIRAEGSEFDIRRFLCDVFVRHEFLWEIGKKHQQETLKKIGRIVHKNIQSFDMIFSEAAYQVFVEYIYIAIWRIREERFISFQPNQRDYLERKDYYFVEALVQDLKNDFMVEWPEQEILCLAAWMCGSKSRNQLIQYRENLVIRNEVYTLLGEILESVYQEFRVDFRGNLELHMSLLQHMMPMDIRLKYGLKLANPLLADIRSMYPLAWQIAGFMAVKLEHIYEVPVSDDEIGYLAVIFELALQKKERGPEKKNVLLVYASGRGTIRLLQHQMESKFQDYIARLDIKATVELKDADFENIDLVLTTVPLNCRIQVPVIEINELLTLNDQAEMRLALQSGKPFPWEIYYKEDLFFTGIRGEDKEDILCQMCKMVSERYPMPEDFFQSVMNREKTVSTDIGIRSALPHPDRLISEKTVIAVGILDEPVFWGKKEVSLVILALIGKRELPDIQKFYEGTIRLISDGEAINRLEEHRDYQTLIRLLSGS